MRKRRYAARGLVGGGREVVVCSAVQHPSGRLLAHAAPLLEEEGHTVFPALSFDIQDPVLLHAPGARTALAAGDHPMDAGQVDGTQVFQKRFQGGEAHDGGGVAQRVEPHQSGRSVLHAHAVPDVGETAHPAQFAGEQTLHAAMSLGQHLERVPAGAAHHRADGRDEVDWHVFVKQIAHGVNEDSSRAAPRQGLVQLLRHEPEVETLFERMSGHASEALGERLRVAVRAAGADLGAATDRVPGGIRPFDG